jgi:hypothetical protein
MVNSKLSQRGLRRKIGRLFIGKEWNTFASVSLEDLRQSLELVINELNYEYEYKEVDPSPMEKFMYGTNRPSFIFNIKNPVKIRIKGINARGDPSLRIAFFLVGSSTTRQSLEGVSLITISPLSVETEPHVKDIIQRLVKKLPKKPWDLKHHPRFRTSPLLLFKVKNKWKYWLDESKI